MGDVWGVGRRWTVMLEGRGINTAHDFANAPDGWVRQRMGVVTFGVNWWVKLLYLGFSHHIACRGRVKTV